MSSSPWASIILNTDAPHFSISWINPPGLQLPQANASDLLDKTIFDLFTGSATQPVNENVWLRGALDRAISSKSVQKTAIHYLRKRDGATAAGNADLWNLLVYPVCDTEGNILFLALNPQLDRNQRITSNILERIKDSFYAVDRD